MTSGELQKREDTLVDLTNFKDRLEQLADKGVGHATVHMSGARGDDDDEAESGELLRLQRTLRDEQDQHLESLSQVLGRQKQLGQMIGDELDLQNELLEDLDTDVDRTRGRMGRTMNTLDKVSKEVKSRKGTIAVVTAVVVIVVLIIVLIVVKTVL